MVNETVVAVAEKSMTFSQGLDKVLAVVIPLVVFAAFGFMMYKAFQEPLDRLFAWISYKWNESNQVVPVPKNKGMIFDSRADIYR